MSARARSIIAALKATPGVSTARIRELIPERYHHLIRSTKALRVPKAPRR